MHLSPPRAWAEIDLDALRHNFRFAKAQSNEAEVMAVVKANAYGHGYQKVVEALQDLNPAFYGVANVREARELRALLPEARIYLLGIANPSEYQEIVEQDYTPCISCLDGLNSYAELAKKAKKRLKVHLALDTGMGRGGFISDSAEYTEALAFIHPHIEIEGIGSHLPVADEDEEFTKSQIARFIETTPSEFKYRHISNSAGLMKFPSPSVNLVRPGLMLYGASPLPEYQDQLKPVMRLCSRVSIIRNIPAGEGISYGRTFITQRTSRIATVGIGYADGLPRAISGKGCHVWINGTTAPIVGRVTMDQIMVDVTDHPDVNANDLVEIFGPNLPVSKIAEAAGTIPWEIFTGIAPRVIRNSSRVH